MAKITYTDKNKAATDGREIFTDANANEIKQSVNALYDEKQPNLVSGANIKTVNGSSLLGSGNIAITGDTSTSAFDIAILTYSGSQTFTLPQTITEACYFIVNNGGNLRGYGYDSDVTKNGNQATFTGLQTGDIITLFYRSDGTNEEPAPNTTPAAPTFTAFNDEDDTIVLEPKSGISLSNYRYTLPGDATVRTVPNTGIIPVGNVAGVITAWSIAHGTFSQSPNGTSPSFTVANTGGGGQLPAVTDLSADVINFNQIDVSWFAGAGTPAEATYTLQRSTSPDFSTELTTVYTGPNLSHSDTTTISGPTYYYRVSVSKNGYISSEWVGIRAATIVFYDRFDVNNLSGYNPSPGHFDQPIIGQPVISGGNLVLAAPAFTAGNVVITVAQEVDMRNTEATTDLVTMTTSNKTETIFEIGTHGPQPIRVFFDYYNGDLYMGYVWEQNGSYTQTLFPTLAYNPAFHRFWKLRSVDAGGGQFTWYWDLSGDGQTWTNMHSVLGPPNVLPSVAGNLMSLRHFVQDASLNTATASEFGHLKVQRY